MNLAALAGELRPMLQGSVRVNELMSNHTTWRIGGPADIFIDPVGKEDVQRAVRYARVKGIPLTVIGNGSNLLVRDGGIRGMVIKIGRGLSDITVAGNEIKAGAGAMLPELAAAARRAGLGGFEFAAGIPGSLGGAVVMNAGAMNGCVADVLKSVLVLDERNEFVLLSKEELAFSYRSSLLQKKQYICLETSWVGYPKDRAVIEQETRDYLAKRKSLQPQGWPNAGSVFKNPPGDSAGRLIEAAQGKGLRVGDAEVSPKHANWILNLGQATATDVLSLIKQVQHLVQERFGVALHLEVRVLGED
ncbi:UDP-N-acetylenolpyruvoylglucosamine reductase [Desulfotomaculum nigrificans CO-1-SRB]|uniref:UDP-N-acetylenolpyruvoylglucosamine reductase n=1 Tax=Desulfotomaculum nigrificans (strain DSM 14880 / VKM B-2319 / CO-1-SRB) TaxID=868595 RepID=F6B3E4_DESCC|nr:UDP-N-acetylmuramate dehydrogenase [Desulfotomaculum nigrificans]AEF95175.1 UDP-N-acetylenolpyruvoylglucosamine reductase [Desulfotomaculum nigrificans CO-1-SRB]